MSVKMRQEIERKIVTAVVKALLNADYEISVHNGEEETERLFDETSVLAAMFMTDEDHLFVSKPGHDHAQLARAGWVSFYYGNDGYDVIHDYSVNLEPLMAEAKKISDYYAD